MNSATIKIHLRFADVTRLRIAEISNWSGLALAAPRNDLEFLLEREELSRPGVYLLLGDVSSGKMPPAYIGEAENVRERLKQHTAKDFWITAYILTDKDQSLTKAHVKFLEGRLIDVAKAASRYEIQNSQASGAKLPESERESAEVYLFWARQLLLALGCDLLVLSDAQPNKAQPRPVASALEFERALTDLVGKLTAKHRELLQIHYRAPRRRLTARQIAEQLGYKGFGAANLLYGRLGRAKQFIFL